MNTLSSISSLSTNSRPPKILSTAGTGIIDQLSASGQSAVVAAYHSKLLRSAYTGPLINIRRSSDSANTNFYANTTGSLGTGYLGTGTTLTSWLNGATGYVVIWYDQSGRSKHIIQTTAASQPTFVQSTETYTYLTNSLALPGPNVFDTTTVTNMHMVYASKEITRLQNALVSLNGTAYSGTAGSSASRFTCHCPWSDGVWYFDPGDAVSSAGGNRANSTSGITSTGTKAVFSGYKSSTDGKNGFRVNQGTRYLSQADTSAYVTGGILLNNVAGVNFGSANHYFYGILIFNTKLGTSDETIVETNI